MSELSVLSFDALEQFKIWLPGELEYAATKKGGGYDTRIERARRGDGDRSMYSFLGSEWHHGQTARNLGKHYAAAHQKTGQLQFAKFAAGFFDKVGMLRWLSDELPSTEEAFSNSARSAANTVLSISPWQGFSFPGFDPASELEKPFAETCFSQALLDLQVSFLNLVDRPASRPIELNLQRERVINQTLLLGGRATLCYLEYANRYLTPEQYEIPPSEHSLA